MGQHVLAAAAIGVVLLAAAPWARAPQSERRQASDMAFSAAKATFELLHESWPDAFRGLPLDAVERAWPGWVRRRDAEIRARLERGDEDSLVNLWLYGTTFTSLPPARGAAGTPPGRPGEADESAAAATLLSDRLDDLLDALAGPGGNERLRVAGDILDRRGLSAATPAGRARIRRLLVDARQRVLHEQDRYDREIRSVEQSGERGEALAVHSTLFRDRGLSSDTSILTSFAVEQGLAAMIDTGTLTGRVRHVGIIGPGLDFINKSDGHDFYPLQTLQPFAVLDSLLRLGLADPAGVRVTTFDLNPRVNDHLEQARRRADRGDGYTLHALLSREEAWRPELLRFWSEVGTRIGDPTPPVRGGGTADAVRARAVRVRPAYVNSVRPLDLNIVVERPAGLDPGERLDLLIATNVLVYYDRFEQSLAVTNAAAMLRPGGVFLTNNAVLPVPPLKAAAHHLFVHYGGGLSEHIFWYGRE